MVLLSQCFCYLRSFRSMVQPVFYSPLLFNRNLYIQNIINSNDKMIRVIDESGTNLGLMSKEEAQILARQKRFGLKEIVKATEKIPNSVFKFLDRNAELQQKKPVYVAKKQKVPTKELTMRSQIDENDLKVKSKKLQEFLDRDFHVVLKIVKPKRATRLPREVYENLISKLQCDVKLLGTPRESETFFRCTVVKD